ncbi:T-lymphocyte activation antigen CD86 [Trichomycterus rosablanca]|uniref:T-lymphocyte activation antigen CD86 n=1 Tax=Trichomycterus rosablanca TaxID=2290929 RepID=UPI002F36039F
MDLAESILRSMQLSRRLLVVQSGTCVCEKSEQLLECRLCVYLHSTWGTPLIRVRRHRSPTAPCCPELTELRRRAICVHWHEEHSQHHTSHFWKRLRLSLPLRPIALGPRLIDSTSSHSDLATVALRRTHASSGPERSRGYMTHVVAELHVHGIVGESVHLQCIVSDSRSITRVYFQKEGEKEAIFLNGFERSPVSDSVKAYVKDYVNRTVVDRTRMSMELLHISLADEGVYTCVAFYEPKPHVVLHNDTVIHLNVTANYSVPEISIDRCSDGPTPQSSKICVFSCSSSGGFPLKNINWFVSEHKNSLLRENGDGVNVRDPVSGVWNVSQSVTLNCSQPVNISCSVGGAVSELLHVLQQMYSKGGK